MERLISLDALLQIVTDAGLIHQRDFYTASLSKLIARGGDPLAEISTAYEVAGALGIPEERVKAVLAIQYPEPEVQLLALEAQGAFATTRAVARTYQAELLTRLRGGLPSRSFEAGLERSDRAFDQAYLEVKWRRDYTVKLMLVNQSEAPGRVRRGWRNLFGLGARPETQEIRREEIVLATIAVGSELVPHGIPSGRVDDNTHLHRGDRLYIVVTVSSAVFLTLCAATLETLRARFARHNGIAGHEVVYDYVVE